MSIQTKKPQSRLSCFVCGHERIEYIFHSWDRNRRVDTRLFDIYKCPGCGTGHTIPLLNDRDLQRYYPPDYYGLDEIVRMESTKAMQNYIKERVARILEFHGPGKLLDIGCGAGIFLKCAKEHSFHVEGVEISKEAAEIGRELWKLNIHQGNFLKMSVQKNCYDVVTLSHVFEHLADPLRALRRIRDTLRRNGLLVITVPNFSSLQARIFRSQWFHLDIPRHLYHYSPQNLCRLIESCGFDHRSTNFFSSEHNWAGILGSFMRLSPPGETPVHKAMRKLIGTPLARALAYLESSFNMGGTFELYATKR